MEALTVQILCDKIPQKKDYMIYCFAHHDINVDIMAKTVNALFSEYKQTFPVYILGNITKLSGVSSSIKVKEIYDTYNIEVRIIPYNKESINTRIEVESIVEYFHNFKHNNIILVSPAFHSKRAFMTTISYLIDKSYDLSFYSKAATIYDCTTETISHQGLTKCSFSEMVNLEQKRIVTYTQKGDIRNCNEIIEYLKSRNKKD